VRAPFTVGDPDLTSYAHRSASRNAFAPVPLRTRPFARRSAGTDSAPVGRVARPPGGAERRRARAL